VAIYVLGDQESLLPTLAELSDRLDNLTPFG
jgi:hypothetical protein